jgi:tRNA pseudouridine-54 N-methylase
MSKNSASAAKFVSPLKKSTPLMLFILRGKRNIQRGLHFVDKMCSFHARSQNFEKKIPSVSSCLSVRTEQLCFQCTDFLKILYLSMFGKSVEKIQFSLISDKNNRYFTWRPIYIHDHISLISSQNKKMSQTKVVEKIRTHILHSIPFFQKIVPFMK